VTLVSTKVKPRGLIYLIHANSTQLSQLIRLNFGLTMYMSLDRNFGQRYHFTFWLKSVLRPNLSSSKG